MRPSQLKHALRHLMEQRRSAFIWGPPGVGKSDIVAQIAKEDSLQLIDFRLALRDPTDLKGFPMPDAKTSTMKFFRDGELPTKGKGILFMDELNSAPQATMATAMQLCLPPFAIGDYTLPVGWRILGAGNRESDRAVVHRLPSALSLRFTHVDMEVSLDDWCNWAMDNAMPMELIAFLRFRPNLLHKFDAAARSSPNPRSWAFVSKDINAPLDKDTQFEVIKGTVGEGAASEFVAFMQVYKELPSIDQIMLNPDSTPVPTSPATLYALATALGAKSKKDTFDRMMQYVARMPIEFQVVTVRDAVRLNDTVAKTKAFVSWGIKHADIAM